MYEQIAPCMKTNDGEYVALQSVCYEVNFDHLLCETVMTQIYINLEQRPIEAVYTFSLPSNALLLSLRTVIGGKKYEGMVMKKTSAEEQYEDAITEGDTAIMLEQIQPGLYTMNVGNIQFGETFSILISYVELYSWQGDTLRYFLPTVIAPRYGDAEKAGLQPHQIPQYDFSIENLFQIRLTIKGLLADASLDSPSHHISITRSNGKTTVNLSAGDAFMDRDFILNIGLNHFERDFALIDKDFNDGFVVLSSFSPRLPNVEDSQPRSVKIVVDCSGSMAGDSIVQAIQAVNDILDHLRMKDYFNIIAFGDNAQLFFDRQVEASKSNLTKVKRQLRSIKADMGGTQIQNALQTAVHIPGPAIPQDILLITDGEVWDTDKVIRMMKKSNHRVFTVGVGSSISEGFVRHLARETGGACELVVPNEQMTEKIVRHFRRIYLPKAEEIRILWPAPPEKVIPADIG